MLCEEDFNEKKSKMQKYAAVSATILAAMTALSTYQEVEGAEETKDQSVETVQLESAANRKYASDNVVSYEYK